MNIALPSRRPAATAALAIAGVLCLAPVAAAAPLAPALTPAPAVTTGNVVVMLQTDPDGSAGSFSFTHTFGANSSPVVASPFSLSDGQLRFFGSVAPGLYTVSLGAMDGWQVVPSGDGYDSGCWDDQDNSTVDPLSGTASINVSAGEFIVCTFVLRRNTVEPWTGNVPLLSSPRGLGYWKTRSGCLEAEDPNVTGREAAFVRRALRQGTVIFPLGSVSALTCAESTRLLWRVDFDGINRANDAAYNLVSQLIAAKLNKAAGAPVPACVQSAIDAADPLLASLAFTGRGSYLGPGSSPTRTLALALAGQLGRYNEADSGVLAGHCG
jgi:hypothetical protein